MQGAQMIGLDAEHLAITFFCLREAPGPMMREAAPA